MSEEDDGIWFRESFSDYLIFENKLEKVYFTGYSRFQKIDIVELKNWGKTLYLDSKIQSSQIDEKVYHESLVHPSVLLHPNPENVLIIGGGEGATLREVLKYKQLKSAIMVDIDGELVNLCKKYMPEWSSGAFEDKRAELIIDDAKKFIENTDKKFDIIISDLTEPLYDGPSKYLFTVEYYKKLYDLLNPEGIIVLQSGPAFPGLTGFMGSVNQTLKQVFNEVIPYQSFILSFSIIWGFNLGFKGLSYKKEIAAIGERIKKREIKLDFLSADFLRGMMLLPKSTLNELNKGKISTDKKPFVWDL
jgi:spermidine synthase